MSEEVAKLRIEIDTTPARNDQQQFVAATQNTARVVDDMVESLVEAEKATAKLGRELSAAQGTQALVGSTETAGKAMENMAKKAAEAEKAVDKLDAELKDTNKKTAAEAYGKASVSLRQTTEAAKDTTVAVTSLKTQLLLIGGTFAAVFAAGAAGFAAWRVAESVADTAKFAFELDNAATRLGVTIEFLSVLNEVAARNRISLHELEESFKFLEDGIVDFNTGGSKLTTTIRILGPEIESLIKQGTSLEGVFIAVSDRLKELGSSERTAVILDLFGRSGAKAIPTLLSDFDEAAAKAQKFGVILDQSAGDASKRFNTALEDLKSSVRGLLYDVILPLMPVATDYLNQFADSFASSRPTILNFFADIVEGFDGTINVIDRSIKGITSFTSKLETTLSIFDTIVSIPGKVFDSFSAGFKLSPPPGEDYFAGGFDAKLKKEYEERRARQLIEAEIAKYENQGPPAPNLAEELAFNLRKRAEQARNSGVPRNYPPDFVGPLPEGAFTDQLLGKSQNYEALARAALEKKFAQQARDTAAEIATARNRLAEYDNQLKFDLEIAGKSREEKEVLLETYRLEKALREANSDSIDTEISKYRGMIEEIKKLDKIRNFADEIGSEFSDLIHGMVDDINNLQKAFENLLRGIGHAVVDAAVAAPLKTAVSNFVTGALAPATGAPASPGGEGLAQELNNRPPAIVQNIQINTPDANSFRKSKGQLAEDLRRSTPLKFGRQ